MLIKGGITTPAAPLPLNDEYAMVDALINIGQVQRESIVSLPRSSQWEILYLV